VVRRLIFLILLLVIVVGISGTHHLSAGVGTIQTNLGVFAYSPEKPHTKQYI